MKKSSQVIVLLVLFIVGFASASTAQNRSGKPKVLMPIGDGTEVVDTYYPYFRLLEAGFDVVVAGPEARLYNLVTHEVPPGASVKWDITQEGPGYHLEADIAFKDIIPEEYVGMFVSGGRAPEYIRYDRNLLKVTQYFFEKNLPVAVVCHGVEIVAAADVIRGRKLTTVPKCEFDITQNGGIYVPQELVIDGNLISCRTWHDYGFPYMKTFIELLNKQSK
jgi:protease I